MVGMKALLSAAIVLLVLVSCATMPRPSSAASQLYENCPLRVSAGDSAGAVSVDNVPNVPDTSRLLVIISDLHMGIGKDPQTGSWYEEEDFRWGPEFALFLKEVDRLGEGKTDLILNGDTFELWQSAEADCRHADKNLGCTEKEALHRINRVISQHRIELTALGQFADSGLNRVVLLPGNHDAAILFSEVGKAVLAAIPAATGRVRIASEGFWLSPDQRVYVEHGHQIGKEVNCLEGWPTPFLMEGEKSYLQRPWGEQFVQEYFNTYEKKYPIIDNFSGEQEGIRYGLAAEGPAGAVKGARDFLGFFLLKVSWEQFAQFLGEEGEPPTWDVGEIRKKQGDRFLVESLPADSPLREAAFAALSDNTLSLRLADFSDDEIVAMCDRRAMQNRMQDNIAECPRQEGKLGAAVENLMRSRNSIFADHLRNTYRLLSVAKGVHRHFDIFVFGHTHGADPGFTPLKENWNPTVVNSGAWQRVVSPNQLKEIVKAKQLTDEDVLTKLLPEDLPACYSLVMIKGPSGRPIARLRYWRKDNDQRWGIWRTCSSPP